VVTGTEQDQAQLSLERWEKAEGTGREREMKTKRRDMSQVIYFVDANLDELAKLRYPHFPKMNKDGVERQGWMMPPHLTAKGKSTNCLTSFLPSSWFHWDAVSPGNVLLRRKYSLGALGHSPLLWAPWLLLPHSAPCHLPGIYLKRMASSFERPLNKRLVISPVAA